MMTLKQLAKQYKDTAQSLLIREEYIKSEIKNGRIKNNIDAQNRIMVLREERYQALETANYLENYYAHRESASNA